MLKMARCLVNFWILSILCIVFVRGQLTDKQRDKLRTFGTFDETGNCAYLTRSDGTHSYWVVLFDEIYVYPGQDCAQGTRWDPAYCTCVPLQQQQQSLPDPLDPRSLAVNVSPVPGACSVLANISYNSATGTFESATYVQMGDNAGKAKLNELRVQGPAGSSSSFVMPISGTPLLLQSFNGNQLLGPWQSKLRFQPSKEFRSSAVLMTDDCKSSEQQPQSSKSLEIVYTGSAISVYFRFKDNVTTQSCSVRADANGWYLVEMTSVSTDITVTVNGNICVRVDSGAALWMKCGLSVGGGSSPAGSSLSSQSTIYLDYFQFFKNPQSCK